MVIRKKRVKTPQRYLYALHPGDKFYIAVLLGDADYPRLACYGIKVGAPARIPTPRGTYTSANADGTWRVLKHLPKVPRAYMQNYHVIDWYGDHHYGVCWHRRLCYQREFVPPTELAFVIENGVLYSPLLENSQDNLGRIKVAMNVMLEMLGRCEVWTAERAPALPPVKQIEVPWEILPPGTRLQEDWKQYVDKIVERKPRNQQTVILQRHEHLWQMSPDFCSVGAQNFWGYVVYGFTALGLFIFECNEINNATYVFRGDWEAASHLTKTQVISGRVYEARIYHTEKWQETISKLITNFGKEAA